MTDLEHAWQWTDALDAPDQVLYLDTVRATGTAQAAVDRSIEFLDPHTGDRVLDIGCGTGDDVLSTAKLVGLDGLVVGLDANAGMIAEAVSRASSAGLPVSYCVGDAHHLGFADNAFSGANVSRVLQHLSNPRATLAEAARVVRSSGKIVVGEPDWETLVVNAENRDLTRRIVNFMCDCRVRNGWMGRQLPSLFQEAGFADIVVDSITGILRDLQQADRLWGFRRNAHRACDAGVVSTSERDEWTRNLEALDANHAFFSSLSGFMVVGRVP